MTMYSVTFRLGQALVNAKSLEAAKKYALREWGESNAPYRVAEASLEDQAWVENAGGMVHEAP